MKQLRLWVLTMWQPALIGLVILLAVGCVLGYRLGPLTHGVSGAEKDYINSISSGTTLLKDPSFVVHKLPIYVLFKLHVTHVAAYRAVSAVFAAAAVFSVFFTLKFWYSLRVSLIGSGLFLVSAWTLHIGRLAVPEASFLLLAPLIWAGVWIYSTSHNYAALLVLSTILAVSVYIPGFFWLVLVTVIWQRKSTWDELQQLPGWILGLCAFIIIIGITPFIWASVANPHQLLVAAGLPLHLPSFVDLGRQFVSIPKQLFRHGPRDPTRWLGQLPLLDAFSVAMLALGAYSLLHHLSLIRTRLIVGSGLLVTLLITAGGLVTITTLLPVVYFLVAEGIAFMLHQWFVVFPRNPIAHIIASSLMAISVGLVVFYHFNHYFIAWPQAPATRAAFHQSLLK